MPIFFLQILLLQYVARMLLDSGARLDVVNAEEETPMYALRLGLCYGTLTLSLGLLQQRLDIHT